jgi:hypothetical protein
MEPETLLKDHLGLTLPWRGYVPDEAYLADPDAVLSALREIGVQAVLSWNPSALSVEGTIEYRDSLGRITYVKSIPKALPGPFPDAGSGQVQRLRDGRLFVGIADSPPALISSRKIRWVPQQGRAWIGIPQVLALHWLLGTVMLAILSLWLSARSYRRK